MLNPHPHPPTPPLQVDDVHPFYADLMNVLYDKVGCPLLSGASLLPAQLAPLTPRARLLRLLRAC